MDDEVDNLEAIEDILINEGYTVVTATNGRAALDQLEEFGSPCLILLDIMMPLMDGYEVLARLITHPLWRALPVAVMTATYQPRIDGVVAILQKPFGISELLAVVAAFCPKQRVLAG